jgi:predicted dehydrogenase
MDAHHLPSTMMALEAGYDVFLEKPMAVTPRDCLRIAEAARARQRIVQICHPLRYTPFYIKARELLTSGAIGRVISLTMVENVGYWHFAHSYVRGNWGVAEKTGPLILTKCCHDMDLAVWLAGDTPVRVASFGALNEFRSDRAPQGAPSRCPDGCPVETTCPYFAPAMYMGDNTEWPVSVISSDPSAEARWRALLTGPYGRCVYRCDNTAVDHQTVLAEFANGVSLGFSVHANSFHPCRTLRVTGSEGELNGHLERAEISVVRFTPGQGLEAKPRVLSTAGPADAHHGGDTGAITNFLRCVRDDDKQGAGESLDIAVTGHLLAFAAEQARVTQTVVDMQSFRLALAG